MTITAFDEFYIHQIQQMIDKVGSDSPNAFERCFISCHNADGTLNLHAGIGSYPNTNVMDGFVCVRYKEVQRNIFLSRHLESDRANLAIGPFSIEVLEPLKRLRIELGENDYGIGCSLEFKARGVPWPRPYLKYPGGMGDQAGYDQGARFSGSITFEDKKFNANGFFGGRDRTWGARGVANTKGETYKHGGKELGKGDLIEIWSFAHFSDCCLHIGFTMEFGDYIIGRKGVILYDDGTLIPIEDMRHRIEFVPGTRQWSGMELLLKDANGKERHVTINPISPECHLKGGRHDAHGKDRGIFHVEGEKWDVSKWLGLGHELFSNFNMNHRIATFQMDGGEIGVGFFESMFSLGEDWVYKPTW